MSNIDRVFNPKKSNLTSPDSSVYFILNCVEAIFDLGSLYNGIISTKGLSPITNPAACVAAFFNKPSNFKEILNNCEISSPELIAANNFGSISRASFKVVGEAGLLGINLHNSSTFAYGIPKTLPTSLNVPLACSEPKVIIWATRSSP